MGTEQPSTYYDAIYSKAKKYNRHYTGVRWLPLFEKAATLIQGSIFEIGCGVGQFANLIHDKGVKQYTGIDFSKEAIDRCKRLNLKGYDFYQDDVYGCLEIDLFDTIVALETFEHLDDLRVINTIPKGKKLVISLPTFGSESHLIWFSSADEIIKRYKSVIKIDYIERISDWFLFSGVKI
jgi:2-polyprenyl-3-methyl-5-hydroxy-6-metoxy-1,4-benzoquinol methylase